MPAEAQPQYPPAPAAPPRRPVRAGWAIAYVAAVLGLDALASLNVNWPIPWSLFRFNLANIHLELDALRQAAGGPEWLTGWMGGKYAANFELSKFLLWFVIPFGISVWRMDWRYWGFRRWKRVDAMLLLGLAGAGVLAVFIIPYFPELRQYYPSLSRLSPAAKWEYFNGAMIWTASWLIGWEFLHRYFLLRQVSARWPRFGWLLVPLSETLYHLQKAPIEALGMGAFGLVATYWALRRRNFLLPLIAHAAIEVALVLFMLFF